MEICILGDSITYGRIDPEEGGWASRLRNYFEKENRDEKVYVLGIPGDKTKDLLVRAQHELKVRDAKTVVFAIGTNDSQCVETEDNPGVPLLQFRKNLGQLHEIASAFTDKVIFVGLTAVDESKTMPIPWSPTKYYTNEKIKQYDGAIRQFCEEKDAHFVPMMDLLSSEELADGLHPNSAGHQKMFERMKTKLKSII